MFNGKATFNSECKQELTDLKGEFKTVQNKKLVVGEGAWVLKRIDLKCSGHREKQLYISQPLN